MTLWLLALLALAPGGEASVELSGQVRMEAYRGGPGLPGALVEVRQGDRVRSTVTDRGGYYRIEGLEAGEASLQVRHLAAEPEEMILTLPARGPVRVDVEMGRRVLSLPPVEVRSRSFAAAVPRQVAPLHSTTVRNPALRLRVLESTSGMVESGLARGSRTTPPGEPDPPPEQALFMRGSTVDSRMVLLNGAPILTPFHLAGLVPSFDPRSLREATIHLGGAPSRFEGGLSYVLDVESAPADPDGPRVEAAVDGLAMRAGLNLPMGDAGGIAATARGFHGAQAHLTPSARLPYSFRDLLVRGDAGLGPAGDLRLTFFHNREGVVLDAGGASGLSDRTTDWGNHAVSVRWRAEAGSTRLEVSGASARYSAVLPVIWDAPVLARSGSDRHRLELQGTRPWSALRDGGILRFGGSFERQALGYSLDAGGRDVERADIAARLEADPSVIAGDRIGAFAEFESSLTDRVEVRAGGRADRFGGVAGVRWSPRVGIRIDLTDEARLGLSGGRFHQWVPEPGLQETLHGGEPSHLRWDAGLGVASATHLVIDLDQRLSDEVTLGVSGFAKRFETSGGAAGGLVHASGTDLRIVREGERLDAWTGYALSWFWEPGPGGRTASSFAGRHLLTAGATARNASGFEVGASIEYGAGLPLTEMPLVGAEDAAPPSNVRSLSGGTGPGRLAEADNPLDLMAEEAFLRLDLEASWVTHPHLGGRRTELRPYFRLLNALHRRDALFYYFERWQGEEIRPVVERPVLPLIGLEWRF